MLVSDEEIERRKREEGIPDYPESQTPWQEIYRASVDQLDGGGVLEAAPEVQGHRHKDTPPQSLMWSSGRDRCKAPDS